MLYKTQMEAARKGSVTKELAQVAREEELAQEELLPLVASGRVAVPANINHKSLHPYGIGEGMRTKINVNLGISGDCVDYSAEMEKVLLSEKFGVESIMDLSNYGKTRDFRKKLIGTATAYDRYGPRLRRHRIPGKGPQGDNGAGFSQGRALPPEEGVDFMTIHAGINRRAAEVFMRGRRQMNIVSRGGSLLFAWMRMTGNENPFYEHYDELLDILREYDVTISLGDALPPRQHRGFDGRRADRRAHRDRRFDEARLGTGCTGPGRRAGAHGDERDSRQYEA
jgi:phosphomethylpyrimidine synthase